MGIDPSTLPMSTLNKMSREDREPLGKAGVTMDESIAKHTFKREKELQQRCVALLRMRGIICNVSRTDRRKTDKTGWPDITFAFPISPRHERFGAPGFPCAFECKLPGQHPTPEQTKVMEQLMDNGWHVRVVTSEEQFRHFLQTLETLAGENDSVPIHHITL